MTILEVFKFVKEILIMWKCFKSIPVDAAAKSRKSKQLFQTFSCVLKQADSPMRD